ncbi:MAG TPA: purine nucleoside phosphorylase DeoD-type, partial [Acholeplasmataceae bacterium]|nr:purine nucleoside phosphorylase DeoD-type [Acholeplasmataceae bacterium]
MIPTPHIDLDNPELIAKTVLMPGDPLRAKYIADTFLTNVVQINQTRNMWGYTGNFGKKKVTVMGSGMGMASIGIYSYELFAFYGVENIIRIGSCGSYTEDLNV